MSSHVNSSDRTVPKNREGMLKINEIFHSLQGEARDAGKPTVFIRLTGCPLRCSYCDSAYAFHGGEWMHIDHIVRDVAEYGTRYICVTGGEPLAQKRCHALLTRLCDAGYEVSLETSGAVDVSRVDPRVSRVVDIKTPDSGEAARNQWDNLDALGDNDQVKFVVCSRRDYDWALAEIRSRGLEQMHELLISPCWQRQDATELAGWVLRDQLAARVQLQLHKILWGDVPGK